MALKDQKDVLIAWINGADMQANICGRWYDCGKFGAAKAVEIDHNYLYRIKPKEIVTTTCIGLETIGYHSHPTYTRYPDEHIHNLRLTWEEGTNKLLKAEVI